MASYLSRISVIMKQMNRKDRLLFGAYTLISAGMLILAFAAGYIVRGRALPFAEDRYPLLIEAQDILDRAYLGDVPDITGLNYELVRGLVTAYNDPYTVFVEPVQAELNADDLSGSYGGIGSILRRTEAGDLALSPFPDSPAAEAGLQEGDLLLAVGDTSIAAEMTIEEIVALVRGPEGTRVTLTVQTGDDDPRDVRVERRAIDIPSVTWRVLDNAPTIGLITLIRFSDRSAEEVADALADFEAQGVEMLILDLRNNGGGLLDASIDVADLFLDGGVVLYEQRLNEPEETYSARPGGAAIEQPLVILVNGNSASASEILAGALRELGRATLIGQNTFGKNSVQLIFELTDGSSLHVTHARWFTPDRTDLAAGGLTPDIVLEFDAEAHQQGFDPELDRAVEYLQNTAE